MEAKTGVYICSGCGIKDSCNVEAVAKMVEDELDVELCKVDPLVCGDECVAGIKADIEAAGLDHVVIAGCSGRYFSDRFKFGDNVLIDRVALREFVAWTSDPQADIDDIEEVIQEQAEDYLRMSAARMKYSEAPVPMDVEETSRDIMVVGAGVAGLNAALAAADAGYKVTLVEKEAELGGWSRKFKTVIPQAAPYREPQAPPHTELVKAVNDHELIKVLTSSTVTRTSGQPGQFDVTIQNGSGEEKLRIGAIVQATGWLPYDPTRLADKYGYGRLPNVITNVMMEEMAAAGRIARPSDGAAPKTVAIIHCAGSRDREFLPYCSAVCCRVAMKQALYIREQMP
ncbi:MAG TPA: CoB--CoM heterodisulfide reductase iron-sulfur subunit A family protein, partial [Bacteroidetes bacterium]|nr:CoB--CoM heterodisulfide reductase iron-sulfur subunit A family protein [Bacteroidota bacterium]